MIDIVVLAAALAALFGAQMNGRGARQTLRMVGEVFLHGGVASREPVLVMRNQVLPGRIDHDHGDADMVVIMLVIIGQTLAETQLAAGRVQRNGDVDPLIALPVPFFVKWRAGERRAPRIA